MKVNGTDLFCPFDTADAGGFLFAITRDRTDGEGFAFVDMLIEPADPAAPVLVGGKDDPPSRRPGFHVSWDVLDDANGNVIGTATVDATSRAPASSACAGSPRIRPDGDLRGPHRVRQPDGRPHPM